MPEEINHPVQGSKYDKIFRENMHNTLPGIIKHVLHLNVNTVEELADDVQFTKERKTDLLKKVRDNKGNRYVLHVEYQTDNYPEMAFRMAEYSIMLQRKHKLPVKQFVIYIGPAKANMSTSITTKDFRFRYNLTELSAVNYKLFLKSDLVEEKMLAILSNLASESTESVLAQVVQEIETHTSTLEQGRYFRQLRILLQLRNLNKKAIKDMALVGKIFKEEKDILYRRGEIKGRYEEALEIALEMLVNKYPIEEIIKLTKLSKEEIQSLQK
ncbi:Rpn family recombination-promoting nuclease/putative transposase [Pedobacter heparinus]|uniref:Uncharacterized protein n=1 Tax=Pedobacter heparinus (strain ATCC 13125 / DSM 2366 / CIP 104194 / JCM 7457 / NBRC 12017 / NCIMB 9290 / NRRL B-14731 / HIM 762-3) TaxID=485917 RepID=C6XVA9_PEDHD|nr:Rpn family recombination-promoting nuclease/putative transposase [Pedobacter heparinus]ACU03975.1 hypothetical protein Phep_1766 [Pedobacter heparinus DSM 2366]